VHPDHVAELVAEQAIALEEKLQQLDLPVTKVELRQHTNLLVSFKSRTTRSIAGITGIPGVSEVPLLGTTQEEEFVLFLECDDFDSQAPTVVILDSDEVLLPPERWPHDGKNRGIVQGHPDFGPLRKFFCRPGTREFHSHPQHEDTPWDAERESMTIDGLVLGILRDLKERWTIRGPVS